MLNRQNSPKSFDLKFPFSTASQCKQAYNVQISGTPCRVLILVDPVLQNTAKLVFWSIFSHPGCHFGCPFDPLGSDLAHFGTNFGESGGVGSSSEACF